MEMIWFRPPGYFPLVPIFVTVSSRVLSFISECVVGDLSYIGNHFTTSRQDYVAFGNRLLEQPETIRAWLVTPFLLEGPLVPDCANAVFPPTFSHFLTFFSVPWVLIA